MYIATTHHHAPPAATQVPTEYQQNIDTEYQQITSSSGAPAGLASGAPGQPGRPSPLRLARRCCWYSVGTLC